MRQKLGWTLAVLIGTAAIARAMPTVVVGNHIIPTGTASFPIPISVTGGDPLTGMTLVLEISQGGIFQATGGPSFTSINISTGTIWTNPDTQGVTFSTRSGNTTMTNTGGVGGPATWTPAVTPAIKTKDSFLLLSGSAAANGLIATVTVSTVGIPIGTWDLKITGMVSGNGGGSTSSFPGYAANQISLTNGTIGWIPEPSSVVLGLFALGGLGAVANRQRRIQRLARR